MLQQDKQLRSLRAAGLRIAKIHPVLVLLGEYKVIVHACLCVSLYVGLKHAWVHVIQRQTPSEGRTNEMGGKKGLQQLAEDESDWLGAMLDYLPPTLLPTPNASPPPHSHSTCADNPAADTWS